jgi:hypothetical protein
MASFLLFVTHLKKEGRRNDEGRNKGRKEEGRKIGRKEQRK